MAKKAAVSVAELVRSALLNASNAAGEVKLFGKGELFTNNKGANQEAIAECTNPAAPLLTVLRTEGKAQIVTLAPAGFERIAPELPAEKVGPLAKMVAGAIPLAARAEFLQSVIGRTPLAAAELIPVLEEAVAAEKAEHEARVAAAQKRAHAERAARAALERAVALFEERRTNRLDALRREYEAEGATPPALRVFDPAGDSAPVVEPPVVAVAVKTDAERDFRRESADQFASSWRQAWDAQKTEALEYLEAAMWNIRALKPGEEAGTRVSFDGRYHECERPAFTGDAVKVVRPGWALEEGPGRDYVVLKAVVEKV